MSERWPTGALTLADYGWEPYFQAQLEPAELPATIPVRVLAVHRNRLEVAGPDFEAQIPPISDAAEAPATVGDWLLIDRASGGVRRILARKSLFKRRGPAGGGRTSSSGWRPLQFIAANVDTLFIVSSCNQDFNPARLERYLALARDAAVLPIMVLTKADLATDAADYASQAAALLPGLHAVALDARSVEAAATLAPWITRGQTVALIGSSGVGKSTLLNTLCGAPIQATAPIRERDAQGRHTTSRRSLHHLPAGGWLLDTPGLRELWLAGIDAGIDNVFADLLEFAGGCRFSNCQHEAEPDCAVKAAIATGALDPQRLIRYRKLVREEARNAETLADARARSRGFGRMVRTAKRDKKGKRED